MEEIIFQIIPHLIVVIIGKYVKSLWENKKSMQPQNIANNQYYGCTFNMFVNTRFSM